MVWVVVVLAWLGLGALTATVAQRRDHDRWTWLVLGLVFPGASLLVLVLALPRTHVDGGGLSDDVRDALGHSRVARVLARRPGIHRDAVVEASGLDADRVREELRTLRVLGLASRARDRTWTLSPRAAAALEDDDR